MSLCRLFEGSELGTESERDSNLAGMDIKKWGSGN